MSYFVLISLFGRNEEKRVVLIQVQSLIYKRDEFILLFSVRSNAREWLYDSMALAFSTLIL